MSTRCGQCGARLPPAIRRCRVCGAVVERPGPVEVITLARPPAPYASGDPIAGSYTVIEHHGSGPLGATYLARAQDGRSVAVKIITEALLPTAREREAFVAEFRPIVGRVMPHVALPLEVGVDFTDLVFVVSPWVHGASLRRILRGWHAADRLLDVGQVLGILDGAAAALRELHTSTSHGAFYPENIHVTSEGVILTDAALAGIVPGPLLARHIEHYPDVAAYMAPEVRAGKRCNAGADLHGLGALASELLTGDPTRAREPGFTLGVLGPEVAEAVAAMVSDRPAQRAAALPLLLERLARIAGPPGLPHFSLMPEPIADGRAGTSERPPRSSRPPPPPSQTPSLYPPPRASQPPPPPSSAPSLYPPPRASQPPPAPIPLLRPLSKTSQPPPPPPRMSQPPPPPSTPSQRPPAVPSVRPQPPPVPSQRPSVDGEKDAVVTEPGATATPPVRAPGA